jgi:hypothetical protein
MFGQPESVRKVVVPGNRVLRWERGYRVGVVKSVRKIFNQWGPLERVNLKFVRFSLGFWRTTWGYHQHVLRER